MQDYEAADCPMSEPFRAKIGITVFLACLFYQGFITRIIFAPLMPAIETDMGLSHAAPLFSQRAWFQPHQGQHLDRLYGRNIHLCGWNHDSWSLYVDGTRFGLFFEIGTIR